MTVDISEILREWPLDPERNVRRIIGDDGSPKLQVRLPLGVEQYELEGRPDGVRPGGADSYFALCRARLQAHVEQHGCEKGFSLAAEDCVKLRQESLLYYFRYLLCFQIGEYSLVDRDTRRNMDLFRFVHEFAERGEDRDALNQYWPYIIRMNAMARAMDLAQRDAAGEALEVVEEAVRQINALDEVANETFSLEKMRSLGVLEQMRQDLLRKRPPDEREIVRQRLRRAVTEENYERAAQLRDLLRSMGEE